MMSCNRFHSRCIHSCRMFGILSWRRKRSISYFINASGNKYLLDLIRTKVIIDDTPNDIVLLHFGRECGPELKGLLGWTKNRTASKTRVTWDVSTEWGRCFLVTSSRMRYSHLFQDTNQQLLKHYQGFEVLNCAETQETLFNRFKTTTIINADKLIAFVFCFAVSTHSTCMSLNCEADSC